MYYLNYVYGLDIIIEIKCALVIPNKKFNNAGKISCPKNAILCVVFPGRLHAKYKIINENLVKDKTRVDFERGSGKN